VVLCWVDKVANAGPIWNPPEWTDYGGRHFPNRSLSWRIVVQSTGERKGVAKYHLNMTGALIERVEMECLGDQGHEILPHPKPNVRMFWRELPDLGFPVGASIGRDTTYIYVEYNCSGPVHGRPITLEELRMKGADL